MLPLNCSSAVCGSSDRLLTNLLLMFVDGHSRLLVPKAAPIMHRLSFCFIQIFAAHSVRMSRSPLHLRQLSPDFGRVQVHLAVYCNLGKPWCIARARSCQSLARGSRGHIPVAASGEQAVLKQPCCRSCTACSHGAVTVSQPWFHVPRLQACNHRCQ